jgi:hypothetical protein
MRKIEQRMVDAIRNRKNFRLDNTEVRQNGNSTAVLLHGNLIATIDWIGGVCGVGFENPKHQTATTKSRMNAVLRELCGVGVYQHRKVWYFSTGTPFRVGQSFPMRNAA